MHKFSIITTTYQHEKFIGATIDSIIAQSFTDWELLVGDDSPDDKTWNIIQLYIEKYPDKIRGWHHSPNKGIVENMNFLLSQVSPDSEYMGFLEWDDTYRPDCLIKKLEIFKKYPEVALVYSDIDFMNWDSERIHQWLLSSQGVRFYQNERIPHDTYIGSRNPLMVSYSSVAIRKSSLDQFLPIQSLTDSKVYAVSDYDLFFRLSCAYPVYGIQESLTQYRRHSNNLSSNYGWLFDDLLLLIEKYRTEALISEDTYRKKVSWIYILKSVSALSLWERGNTWKYLQKANERNLFADIFYKIAIVGLIILPTFFTRKIIIRVIHK